MTGNFFLKFRKSPKHPTIGNLVNFTFYVPVNRHGNVEAVSLPTHIFGALVAYNDGFITLLEAMVNGHFKLPTEMVLTVSRMSR